VVLLLPATILLMTRVHRHYRLVAQEISAKRDMLPPSYRPPIVIVPIERWNAASRKTLGFAMTLSPEVRAVHIACGEDDSVAAEWQSVVAEPAQKAGVPVPTLITLRSPYRMVLQPVVDYVLQVEKENPRRIIAVAITTVVERHWYHYFLHNQRSGVLTAKLLLEGDRRINIINVPWYLKV